MGHGQNVCGKGAEWYQKPEKDERSTLTRLVFAGFVTQLLIPQTFPTPDVPRLARAIACVTYPQQISSDSDAADGTLVPRMHGLVKVCEVCGKCVEVEMQHALSGDSLFHQGNSQVHDICMSRTSLNQAATRLEKRIGIAGIKICLCV